MPMPSKRVGRMVMVFLPFCVRRSARLFRFVYPGSGRRAVADDDERCVFLLGAVPVHALAEMSDERTRLRRHRQVGRIELIAGADPPDTVEHVDEAVVGMEMRTAEVALLPHDHLHIEPGLV